MRSAILAELRRRFSQRMLGWALRRQGPDALPLTLRSRRIYILPTRAGWVFAGMIAVTFFAGLNYGNGLAMLLAFWLAGFTGVAMLRTHRSLSGSTVIESFAAPAFAGSTVVLQLTLATPASAPDIRLSTSDHGVTATTQESALRAGCVTWQLALPAPRRGRWHAPTLHLETTAPFGLFRTWAWIQLDVDTVVYPRPHGKRPVPLVAGQDAGRHEQATGLDELTTLRPFREGDSPRQVAWKAYARGAPLLVREYRNDAQATHEFSFEQLSDLGTEARLSQLCRWVIDAATRRESYALRLPGSTPLRGSGARHRLQCLRELALYADA